MMKWWPLNLQTLWSSGFPKKLYALNNRDQVFEPVRCKFDACDDHVFVLGKTRVFYSAPNTGDHLRKTYYDFPVAKADGKSAVTIENRASVGVNDSGHIILRWIARFRRAFLAFVKELRA